MEFISQLRRYKSCNQSQNGCQTSQTRYSKPVRHNSEYRTILTSVCALFACDVVCICTKCHVSRVQHTVHSRRRSHAACSHCLSSRAARSHAGRHHTALTRARVSAGRVALDAASVQLGHADLGQIGADGNSSCSSRITMATEELYDCRPVMRGST